jgi:predicted RNA-binding protein with PUA-like domain
VPLAALKAEPRLAQLGLLRQSRLSVTPVRPEEFDLILALSEEN